MDKNNGADKVVKDVKEDKTKMLAVLCITVCALMFLLGFSSKKSETMITFTEDDVKIISEMQETYGKDITVYKTKDGKLMIEWN